MKQNWHILDELYQTIHHRKGEDDSRSYTASLYAAGTEKIAQKLGEEAVEAVIAAVSGNQEELKKESADLLYHLFVLWAQMGLEPQDVLTILEQRAGTSGLEEKRSRST